MATGLASLTLAGGVTKLTIFLVSIANYIYSAQPVSMGGGPMVQRLAAMAVLACLGVSCHTVHEDLPEPGRGPAAPAPIPVVVVPVPAATPAPPPAAPAPNPGTPTPAPTPAGQGCGLSSGGGSGNACPYERASFQGDVERAIDNVIRSHPHLFNMNDNRCPQGCPFVRDSDGYWAAVTNEMRRLGYCAVNDGEELAVKSTNSWNDQYDIISGDGYIRRGFGSYRSTCYPAWF